MKTHEIDHREFSHLALEIVKLLDGLYVVQAKCVLQEADRVLGLLTHVDINHSVFAAREQEFLAACDE